MPVYRYTLTMLSPIHIGSGSEITPYEYIIREDPSTISNYSLIAIDINRLLSHLEESSRKTFSNFFEHDLLLPALHRRLQGFFKMHLQEGDIRWSAEASTQLVQLYKENLNQSSQRQRQFIINPMIRTGLDCKPFIPGSSIKGAIRTAVLQQVYDNSSLTAREKTRRIASRSDDKRANVKAEGSILGYTYIRKSRNRPQEALEIRADPFRSIRLSDAPLTPAHATHIQQVQILQRQDNSSSPPTSQIGILMFYEVTRSWVENYPTPVTATGTLTVDTKLATHPTNRTKKWHFDHCISRLITAEQILTACNDFYLKRLKEEYNLHYRQRKQIADVVNQLIQRAEKPDPANGESLIRLGRFSHVECITLTAPLRRAKGGKSRSLAVLQSDNNQLLCPLGWAVLKIEPLESQAG